jgi:hypothetical protein
MQLRLWKLTSMRVAALLMLLAWCYDGFWVFLSPFIFGESVMAAVRF